MQTPILQESNYKEEMQTIVEPYLVSIGTEFYLERHAGQKIHCMHYVPENPHAVMLLLFNRARAFFILTFLTISPKVIPDFSLIYLERYGLDRKNFSARSSKDTSR